MAHVHVPPHVVLRVERDYSDSWVAFNSKTFQTIELSPEEFLLFEELKRDSITSDDFDLIWPHVSASAPTDRASSLLRLGVLSHLDGPAQHRQYESILSLGKLSECKSVQLTSPTEIEMCLTRRCNQRCVHCNVSAVSAKKAEKLDAGFWIDLLDQAERLRVLRVTLTGGEPFIRDGINDILEHLIAKPIGCIILTNATLITPEQIEIIGKSSVTLSISLDGVNPEQHDSFRRSPGAFHSTMETMGRLKEGGVNFVISSVLHEGSVESASELLNIAERVGASRLVVVPMAAVGRAKSEHSKRYFPNSDRLKLAVENLKELALNTPGLDVIIGNPDPGFRELVTIQDRYNGATAMSRRNPGLCKAGVYSMAVDEDGLAYSCLRGLQERIHPIGNLREKPLADIWAASSWSDFRDLSLPMVPCRVEEIGRRTAP